MAVALPCSRSRRSVEQWTLVQQWDGRAAKEEKAQCKKELLASRGKRNLCLRRKMQDETLFTSLTRQSLGKARYLT